MKNKLKTFLISALLVTLGFGAGSIATRHTMQVTGEQYRACIASPKVGFIAFLEMLVKQVGVPVDGLEDSIKASNEGESQKKALSAYEFLKKNIKSPAGATAEAFADCLNHGPEKE